MESGQPQGWRACAEKDRVAIPQHDAEAPRPAAGHTTMDGLLGGPIKELMAQVAGCERSLALT